tara:strand:+ start:57 stop:332 length:276 start_codon:yes stop_codon:yes gene_type:complete
MPHKRLHIIYSGSVQGVGFRFTARGIASELGLVGWVSNLRDGNVEVLCEGEEQKLNLFLENIKSEFERGIVGTKLDWEEATGEFTGFGIKF